MNDLPKRKQNRLKNYDYSQNGAYFITICTKNKACIFGTIVGEDIILPPKMKLSQYGITVKNAIDSIPKIYKNVNVDKYVIMPNHVHIMIRICNIDGRIISSPTIQTIIGQMKRHVSKQIGKPIWQTSFYDHIVRNEEDYFTKCQYIENNPAKWLEDELYTP